MNGVVGSKPDVETALTRIRVQPPSATSMLGRQRAASDPDPCSAALGFEWPRALSGPACQAFLPCHFPPRPHGLDGGLQGRDDFAGQLQLDKVCVMEPVSEVKPLSDATFE